MSFIPNTTPTPNWLYNGEMKKMNETELKVVLLVTRKTLGWFDPMTSARKSQDYISQSQFMDFTGKSNRAIATAIQSCVERGWIIAKDKTGRLCDVPDKRARRKVWYQLGSIFTDKISGEESSQDDNQVKSGEHFSESGEVNDINLVKKVHSTKETITKETIQNSNAGVAGGEISKIIDAFKEINPSYKKWFGNTTQRSAASRLIETHGLELVLKYIEALKYTNAQPYAPTVTTPLQLEDKLADLKAWSDKAKNKSETPKYKPIKIIEV